MGRSTRDCVLLLRHMADVLEADGCGFAAVLIPTTEDGITVMVPESVPDSVMRVIQEAEEIEIKQMEIVEPN